MSERRIYPVWIELNLNKYFESQIEDILYKYELILDNSLKEIYLYHYHVKLSPQQYKFLKAVLKSKNGLIGAKTIMYKVKTNKLKGDKKVLSYRIKDKILRRVREEFVCNCLKNEKQVLDLKKYIQQDIITGTDGKIKEKKDELKKIYHDYYLKNKESSFFKIYYPENCEWANIDENIILSGEYRETQHLNINDCLKKLISVKDGIYSTYFREFKE